MGLYREIPYIFPEFTASSGASGLLTALVKKSLNY